MDNDDVKQEPVTCFTIMCSIPFVLTMDEAIADMEQILKDNNLEKDSAYRVLPV